MNEISTMTIVTMTSLEIAQLTGKRHDNITRDTEKIFEALKLDTLTFEATYFDSSNRERKMYNLPKRLVMILVTGYSVKLRAGVVDRLDYLEKQSLQREAPQDYMLISEVKKIVRESLAEFFEQNRPKTEIEKLRPLIAKGYASIKDIRNASKSKLSLDIISLLLERHEVQSKVFYKKNGRIINISYLLGTARHILAETERTAQQVTKTHCESSMLWPGKRFKFVKVEQMYLFPAT